MKTMKMRQLRYSMRIGGLILGLSLLTGIGSAIAQLLDNPMEVPRRSGQNIVPVFEGWETNPDGSFEMYFGYLNRNFEENLVVPIGADNSFSPGEEDRGQPTYFYSRRQRFLFHVRVPKDWGEQDLVWTVTSNGKTAKAYGHLLPTWIIDNRLITANVHGSSQLDRVDADQPPALKVAPVPESVTLPGTLTLTATVTDDGLPKRRPEGRGSGGGQGTFLNAPPLPTQARWPQGLNMTWTVYRGPDIVTFNPGGIQPVVPGKENVTTATFSRAGTYVLQLIASDSALETRQNITVTVRK